MTLPIRARLAVVCGALVGILVIGLGLLVYLTYALLKPDKF